MPNWCQNELTVESNEKDIQEIKAIFESANPFSQLVPHPEEIRQSITDAVRLEELIGTPNRVPSQQTELDALFEKEKQAGSRPSWYDWQITNWGTKWEPDVQQIQVEDDWLLIHFNTAWSVPEPIIDALREKYPDARISLFYREDGMRFAGYH